MEPTVIVEDLQVTQVDDNTTSNRSSEVAAEEASKVVQESVALGLRQSKKDMIKKDREMMEQLTHAIGNSAVVGNG